MIRLSFLCASAILYGIAAEYLFMRLTNRAKLRATFDRMLALALELPLFFDEPAVVWRAQRALIRENLRMLRELALPATLMIAAFLLFDGPMDTWFGRRPLAPGESAVITAPISYTPSLPKGIVFETPGVRMPRRKIVSWRVRAVSSGAPELPASLDIHYSGSRAPWRLWFAIVSMSAAVGIRFLK